MSTTEEPPQVALATTVFEAFNAGDWDRLRSVVSDDVEFKTTRTADELHGVDALVTFGQQMRDGVPDLRCTIIGSTASGSVTVLTIEWKGTHTGMLRTALGELAPSGRDVHSTGRWMIRTEHGRVVSIRALDTQGLLADLGPPEF